MTTVIEGTLDEVREHFNGLSLPREMRLKVNITEVADRVQEETNSYADLERKYANWPRLDGILQIPSDRPMTIDEINDMRDD